MFFFFLLFRLKKKINKKANDIQKDREGNH